MRLKFLFISFLFLAAAGPARGDGGNLIDEKTSRSLKAMFGDSALVTRTTLVLSPAVRKALWDSTKTRWLHDTLTVYRCSTGGGIAGYGFLDDVKGKLQFITMLVGILPDGSVQDVDILVYRESYGGEVANESFRRQFRGATAETDLRPGVGVKNISGATISARAVTIGVKKAVATFRLASGAIAR